MEVGDYVLVIAEASDPTILVEGHIQSIRNESGFVWMKIKGQLYSGALVFPISAKQDTINMLMERKKLKEAYDRSVGLFYDIRNKIARGEYIRTFKQ